MPVELSEKFHNYIILHNQYGSIHPLRDPERHFLGTPQRPQIFLVHQAFLGTITLLSRYPQTITIFYEVLIPSESESDNNRSSYLPYQLYIQCSIIDVNHFMVSVLLYWAVELTLGQCHSTFVINLMSSFKHLTLCIYIFQIYDMWK